MAKIDWAEIDVCQIPPDILVPFRHCWISIHSERWMPYIRPVHLLLNPIFLEDHRWLSAARKAGLKIVDVS